MCRRVGRDLKPKNSTVGWTVETVGVINHKIHEGLGATHHYPISVVTRDLMKHGESFIGDTAVTKTLKGFV